MKFRNLLAATAAISMAAAPAIAQSASSAERAVAPISSESELGGDSDGSGVILAILAVAAIVAGIVIAVGGDDDEPVSAG
ncbi:hypothetical protein [Pelagerythrobacter sp.]|uniref:hypothetical protein n=1 Tax=Pelagerythrobacter sp. TaxID=2800702 RepID=UPI0035AD8B96